MLWLFGDAGYDGYTDPSDSTPELIPFGVALQTSELKAIVNFMERGGGVFATGDHYGLGSRMCGNIPRVRAMRRWFQDPNDGNPNAAPNNYPDLGAKRADTLMYNPSYDTPNPPQYNFNDQSDNIPQTLTFWSGSGSTLIPHAILRGGPGGVNISSFPDHMIVDKQHPQWPSSVILRQAH